MDECQFYDKKRLEQLHRKEEQLFVEAKEKNLLPVDLTNYEVRDRDITFDRFFVLLAGMLYDIWCVSVRERKRYQGTSTAVHYL